MLDADVGVDALVAAQRRVLVDAGAVHRHVDALVVEGHAAFNGSAHHLFHHQHLGQEAHAVAPAERDAGVALAEMEEVAEHLALDRREIAGGRLAAFILMLVDRFLDAVA